ncbi:MAG: hypothetical protein ACLQJR_05825 [Stellaceae bacterium]
MNTAAIAIAPAPRVASRRARAIVRGLVVTGRALPRGPGRQFRDAGMARIDATAGHFYWVAPDGSRVMRGDNILDAEPLQPGFLDRMAEAGSARRNSFPPKIGVTA